MNDVLSLQEREVEDRINQLNFYFGDVKYYAMKRVGSFLATYSIHFYNLSYLLSINKDGKINVTKVNGSAKKTEESKNDREVSLIERILQGEKKYQIPKIFFEN